MVLAPSPRVTAGAARAFTNGASQPVLSVASVNHLFFRFVKPSQGRSSEGLWANAGNSAREAPGPWRARLLPKGTGFLHVLMIPEALEPSCLYVGRGGAGGAEMWMLRI